jgi:hypothetical protein
MDKIINRWIDVINLIFLKINQNVISLPFIIICEKTNPFIDHYNIYHKCYGDNPYSVKEYIIIKLKENNLNYKPFYKYIDDLFETNQEFLTIGLKLKKQIPIENEIYNKWKLIIDKFDILGEISNMLIKGKSRFIIYVERNVLNDINYSYIFHNYVINLTIKEYIINKINSYGIPWAFAYLPYDGYLPDPIGLKINLFQFGIEKTNKVKSPRSLVQIPIIIDKK